LLNKFGSIAAADTQKRAMSAIHHRILAFSFPFLFLACL